MYAAMVAKMCRRRKKTVAFLLLLVAASLVHMLIFLFKDGPSRDQATDLAEEIAAIVPPVGKAGSVISPVKENLQEIHTVGAKPPFVKSSSGETIHPENQGSLLRLLPAAMPTIHEPKPSVSTFHKGGSLTTAHQLGQYSNTTSDVVMVWSHYTAIPQVLMDKIDTFVKVNREKSLVFVCGSNECMNQIDDKLWKHVKALRSLLPTLAKGTPLDDFVSRSAILKLLMGRRFQVLVHEISVLLSLWTFGGLYIDIQSIMTSKLPDEYFKGEWVGNESIFSISRFERRSPFIKNAMAVIQLAYSSQSRSQIQKWDTDSILLNSRVLSQLDNRQVEVGPRGLVLNFSRRDNYGVLTFDHRVSMAKDINAGDEIQTLAALQFLPFVDRFVDRDTWDVTCIETHAQSDNDVKCVNVTEYTRYITHSNPKNSPFYLTNSQVGDGSFKAKSKLRKGSTVSSQANNPNETITIFLNAWYNSADMIWPPKVNLNPLMLSMYFGPNFWNKLSTVSGENYLKNHGPVGARDENTFRVLRDKHFLVYMSACLTLLMHNPNPDITREDVLVVDVDQRALELIVPYHIRKSAITVTHNLPSSMKFDRIARYEKAHHLMELYSRAKLVLTSRIHCALPCVAMGIPVLFVETDVLPGGGGNRSEGLTKLFRTVTVDRMMTSYKGLENFNWDKPENIKRENFGRFRATLWHEIRKFPAFREIAITFGMVPLKPLRRFEDEKSSVLTFFQVYTSSELTQRNRRSLESIFYHHPNAKVRILSNILSHNKVSAFSEAGFHVQVENYTLRNLLKNLQNLDSQTFTNCSKTFLKRIPVISKGKFWYSHETDLIRIVLLYLYGGIYMDTDVILVKSLKDLNNVTAFENRAQSRLNGAVLKFDKHNPFLRECIKEFLDNYNQTVWGANGPELLTRVARRHPTWVCDVYSAKDLETNKSCIVRRLYQQSFYPIEYQNIMKTCFIENSTFDLLHVVHTESFAVHLYNKFSQKYTMATVPGTLCSYLLNKFCVFCGDFV